MTMTTRKNQERRRYGKVTRFPLTDRMGRVVPLNRSYCADRRLNNYQVQVVQADELTFEPE